MTMSSDSEVLTRCTSRDIYRSTNVQLGLYIQGGSKKKDIALQMVTLSIVEKFKKKIHC